MNEDLNDLQDELTDDDDVITLVGQDKQEINFVEIATIANRGHLYAILQPTVLLPGMQEGEAIVFRVERAQDGSGDTFDVELDDEVIDEVFAEYQRLYANASDATDGE